MNSDISSIATLFKKSSIGKEIISHRSENSILDHPEDFIPYSVGGRKRLATCSGVSWIGNQHMVTVNLLGHHLRIYKLETIKLDHETKYQLSLIYQKNNEIEYPDAVMVSGNGKWIAVTHSLLDQKGITIHELNKEKLEVMEIRDRLAAAFTCHGVHFSPDCRFLAFTTLEYPGSVQVYDMNSPFSQVCCLHNNHPHLRPKDIIFTRDSKYVAIIYSEALSLEYEDHNVTDRRLAIHKFDSNSGKIEEQSIASLNHSNFLVNSFELAIFHPAITSKGYQLFITNQYADKVVEILFNPVQNTLEITGSYGGNLSFPHGIDFSEDGKLLAVTNFGDDHVRIFELDQSTKGPAPARPHILLCAHSSSRQLFGAERSFVDLAKAFFHLGYKISCLIPNENMEYTNELARYVDAVYHLPYGWHDHRLSYNNQYINEINSLINKEGIGVVHVNSTVIPDILAASRRAGIKSVLHARELLAEDEVLTAGMGINAKDIISKLVSESDYIIANSKKTMAQFNGYHTYFLYNAIEMDRFDIGPISGDGIVKIGLISSNIPKKGIYDFAALALASTDDPGVEFLLIGPYTPDTEKIKRFIDKIPSPPRLKFIDYISDSSKALSLVDVVINLSLIGESFGRSVAEGMAARRPVIAYNKGAMPELVLDKQTGFLVPPGDLRQVLYWIKWLQQNRAEAIEMGERGRRFVQKTFAFDQFQSNLESIYKKIIN